MSPSVRVYNLDSEPEEGVFTLVGEVLCLSFEAERFICIEDVNVRVPTELEETGFVLVDGEVLGLAPEVEEVGWAPIDEKNLSLSPKLEVESAPVDGEILDLVYKLEEVLGVLVVEVVVDVVVLVLVLKLEEVWIGSLEPLEEREDPPLSVNVEEISGLVLGDEIPLDEDSSF